MTATMDTPLDIKMLDHVTASTVVSEVTIPPVVASQEQPRHKKLVNVTVTILSIAGLFIEDVGARTKKRAGIMPGKFSIRNRSNGSTGVGSPPRKIKPDESAETETDSSTMTASMSRDNSVEHTNSTTKVVASLSRITKNKNVMIHLSSLPLDVTESNTEGGLGKQKKKERNALSSVVHWPEHPQQDDALGYKNREPSSYQFQLAFHAEFSTTTSRFVPQSVPIQVSVSRFGRMYKLGTANLLVSGEENGDSTIAVPVTSCYLGKSKSNTLKSILSGSLTKSNEDKAIRMLMLKGDTLKCGLDPDATLRVLVHVSEPICETLEISPKLKVTTIPSNVQAKITTPSTPSTPRDVQESQQKDGIADDSGVPAAISWEYHPNLATIVVNKPDYGINDATVTNGGDDGTLLRVITQSEDHDDGTVDNIDEPSCSSSAYMSAVEENESGHQCYPSKYDLSTRSSSTATMTTTSVSVLSDLTDGHSWQSQTGIEVIPYSTLNPMYEQVRLRSNSRSLDDKDSVSEETHTTGMTSFGRASTTSSQNIYSTSAKPAQKTWQQRFACGLPVCGTMMYNDSTNAVSTANKFGSISPEWLRMTGRCESLVDHHDDEDSSCSESSTES